MPIEQAKVGRVAAKLMEELEQYGPGGKAEKYGAGGSTVKAFKKGR